MKLRFKDLDHFVERGKIPVMQAFSPRQFPYSFNMIEVRTIGRKKIKTKHSLIFFPPFIQATSMMVTGVIQHHDHFSSCSIFKDQALQKPFECIGIERMSRHRDQFPVVNPDGAKVTHAFPRRCMKNNGILDIPRNPHRFSRSSLLEMTLIQKPDIGGIFDGKFMEFFYMLHGLPDRRRQLRLWASGDETPVCETASGIDVRLKPHHRWSLYDGKAVTHPSIPENNQVLQEIDEYPLPVFAVLPRSIAMDVLAPPHPSNPQNRFPGNDETSTESSEENDPKGWPLHNCSSRGLTKVIHGDGDRILPPQISKFPAVSQPLPFPDLQMRNVSWPPPFLAAMVSQKHIMRNY